MTARTAQILVGKCRAGARAIYLGNSAVLLVVYGDIRMVADSADRGIVPHLAIDGFWEIRVTTWLTENLRHTDRVVNVGANVGYYAMVACRLTGEPVVAIEPIARHCMNIRDSAHLNGFHQRLTVVAAVASAEPGTVMFEEYTNGMTMNSRVAGRVDVGRPSHIGTIQRSVTAVTVDHAAPEATFAFIDSEGHEPQVWAGMENVRSRPGFRAVIEWSPARYDHPESFYEKILSEGFTFATIEEDGSARPASRERMLDGVERMVLIER